MSSLIALAVLGALSALGVTAAANGDANTAIEAAKQIAPHGLKIALAHVPTWTHAHEVLSQHLSQYAQSGTAGGAGTTGVGAAIKKAAAHS